MVSLYKCLNHAPALVVIDLAVGFQGHIEYIDVFCMLLGRFSFQSFLSLGEFFYDEFLFLFDVPNGLLLLKLVSGQLMDKGSKGSEICFSLPNPLTNTAARTTSYK